MTKILGEKNAMNYSPERNHAAIAKAARANGIPSGDAENFAKTVMAKIQNWIRDKEEITAGELRAATAGAMAEYDEDAAYLYGSENRMF